MAADGVVFPIPMSPHGQQVQPGCDLARLRRAEPQGGARPVPRVIAGPRLMSAVPQRDPAGDKAFRRRHVNRHTRIHDHYPGAGLPREDVDGRAAVQEIGHHLRGHFAAGRR